jgi:hypothetical protein
MSGAIPPLPNTSSWRGAQPKHRDNCTFTWTPSYITALIMGTETVPETSEFFNKLAILMIVREDFIGISRRERFTSYEEIYSRKIFISKQFHYLRAINFKKESRQEQAFSLDVSVKTLSNVSCAFCT